MKQISVIMFLTISCASCSKPTAQESTALPKEVPIASSTATLPVKEADVPPEIRVTKGTGIKEKMLLAALNANADLEPQYHHEFVYAMTTDAPESIRMFGDRRSKLVLILTGPSDDLELIHLAMPLDAFIAEVNGQPTGDGAAAFGRCVQRMGFAIDPSWGEDFYNWMNQQMTAALLTQDGVETRHRNIVAKFQALDLGNNKMEVSMMVGTPATPSK